MEKFLCIPMSLDALHLPTSRAVVEAHADFSRLPYVAKDKSDINPDTPYLSEEILSEPLEDEGLYLQAGVHLHWALPDDLTRALHTKDGLRWPTVPNRWLVTRSHHGQVDKQWVVESDYFYPEGTTPAPDSITFPINPVPGQSQPFRYLGRQLPLEAWIDSQSASKSEYLDQLTAMGYGDPNFAALYPNCHSVFGFHDSAPNMELNLQYDVIGLYAKIEDDFLNPAHSFWLQHAFEAIRARYGLKTIALLDFDKKREALQTEFDWQISDPGRDFPERLICYASLTFKQTDAAESADFQKEIKIVVGNTGTEALSAYLADTLPNADKAIVEDQIEALLLQSEGKDHKLDWAFKFREARHEKGFTPFGGETLWSIRPRVPRPNSAQPSGQNEQPGPLPAAVADLLDTLNPLNKKQQMLDRAKDEAQDLRRLLYADWCKYQRCAYPPEDSPTSYPQPDEVRYFIQQKDLNLLRSKLAQVNLYTLQRDQISDALNSKLQSINQTIENDNKTRSVPLPTYTLQPAAGQRYWRPNDLVLLLAGAGIKPTSRHGQDGTLNCKTLTINLGTNLTLDSSTAMKLRDQIVGLRSGSLMADSNTGFFEWTEQPWHPYLLEWEVEMMPVEQDSNLDPDQHAYTPGYITGNFELQVDQVDLTTRPGQAKVANGANVYSGRCFLTPQASQNLTATLKAWLDKQGLSSKDPAFDNIQAVYQQLQSGAEYYQSQSLGGFHEALLMQKQTYQLPLQDPLAFDDHQPFAQQVAELVGMGNLTAPEPLNDYNPIRTGILNLVNLRLVDTFGRTRTLVNEGHIDRVTTAEALTVSNNPHLVYLPPRLSQPARLDFHWLAADGDDVELNNHPATTPVCGWLMPNNLDGTLLVYEQSGAVLGWIEKSANRVIWQPAPGVTPIIYVETIPNPHLQKVVQHILAVSETIQEPDGQPYFDHFLNAVELAWENISPENFAQHEALALIMGHPVAVVRASLNLELKGLPAINHDWNRFRQDLQNVSLDTPRTTDNFTAVKFPIRLGDFRQLNDGLVGYWVETGQGFENDTFYSSQSGANPSVNILTHASGKMNRHQAVADAPETYTMLLDPRGVVHAHCGILPARMLAIPPDQYGSALKAIEVFFLSTPILTPAGRLTLPLPSEPGFSWSWLGLENGTEWQEMTTLEKPNLQANFPAQQQIMEGWLKLRRDEKEK